LVHKGINNIWFDKLYINRIVGNKLKVLITTVPFGKLNGLPLELLAKAGIQYLINPYNKKLTESELIELVSDFDVIIAGTEKITARVMDNAPNLKMISRVGVGLDSVDLLAAEDRGIRVSYTPVAPAPAVAELTIGLMLSLSRFIHISNRGMHSRRWERFFGRRLGEMTIGIIGVGNIGKRVLHQLKGFGSPRILANDVLSSIDLDHNLEVEWVGKEKIYEQADVISIHVPLTSLTRNMIMREQLLIMKKDAILINTARGGVINEKDLYDVLQLGHLSGVAIDVFDFEPYDGPLCEIQRCLLTSHMGSMTVDCRSQMEIEATKEAVRFITGMPLKSGVPRCEFENQSQWI